MHHRNGCDESATEITPQGLREESHSAMVANEGIAFNSSHLLPVVQALDVLFLILTGNWRGVLHLRPYWNKMSIIYVGILYKFTMVHILGACSNMQIIGLEIDV